MPHSNGQENKWKNRKKKKCVETKNAKKKQTL